MSALKWFLVLTAIVGILLFLYGANYYDSVVGWVGVSLVVASLVGLLVLYVYDELTNRTHGQKP